MHTQLVRIHIDAIIMIRACAAGTEDQLSLPASNRVFLRWTNDPISYSSWIDIVPFMKMYASNRHFKLDCSIPFLQEILDLRESPGDGWCQTSKELWRDAFWKEIVCIDMAVYNYSSWVSVGLYIEVKWGVMADYQLHVRYLTPHEKWFMRASLEDLTYKQGPVTVSVSVDGGYDEELEVVEHGTMPTKES